jgi:hypothetical protein
MVFGTPCSKNTGAGAAAMGGRGGRWSPLARVGINDLVAAALRERASGSGRGSRARGSSSVLEFAVSAGVGRDHPFWMTAANAVGGKVLSWQL